MRHVSFLPCSTTLVSELMCLRLGIPFMAGVASGLSVKIVIPLVSCVVAPKPSRLLRGWYLLHDLGGQMRPHITPTHDLFSVCGIIWRVMALFG